MREDKSGQVRISRVYGGASGRGSCRLASQVVRVDRSGGALGRIRCMDVAVIVAETCCWEKDPGPEANFDRGSVLTDPG